MDDPRKLIAGWIAGSLPPAPVMRLVGFRLTAFENGVARMEMDAGPQHHNPMGTVHGGVLCDLADAAMGTAVAATLGEGEGFTTVELSSRFLRPVVAGHLVATARIVQRGRTVVHVEAEVVDGQGRSVARLASTCVVIRPG